MDRRFDGAVWHKSSFSNGDGGNCVETAHQDGITGVRDSKDRDGAVLVFGTQAWTDFLDGVRAGQFG